MPPLTNLFAPDGDDPVEPGSYPLQPLEGEEGEDAEGLDPAPAPLLGPAEGGEMMPDAGD